MKNKGIIITLITIISLLIIALIILMCIFIKNKQSFNFNFSFNNKIMENLYIDKNYEDTFKEIDIDTTLANIEIKRSNDNIIRLKTYSKEEETSVKTENNILKIKIESEKCKFVCLNKKISKIELYLPENYENEININNNYGDIIIDKFENSTINIIEDAGDVSIEESNLINIENKYGDIEIGNVKIGTLKASAGDIKINKADNLNIENKYGDVEIKNINEYANIIVDCGDIEIDNFTVKEDSKIENKYGDIEINKTNAYIDAKTDLGDMKINNNDSEQKLTIKNNCGDIEVN